MKNTHKIALFALVMSLYGCAPYHEITRENIEKSIIACANMGGLKAIEIHGGMVEYGSPKAICKNGYEILIGGNSK